MHKREDGCASASHDDVVSGLWLERAMPRGDRISGRRDEHGVSSVEKMHLEEGAS
jgi:hypothetical protein